MDITKDTIELLKECDAGVKMATASLDDVKDHIQKPDLKTLLDTSRAQHVMMKDEIQKLLKKSGAEEKEPNPIARSMSAMKSGAKLGWDNSDETVANLIEDGCAMGIKSLHRYLNQYQAADVTARAMARSLVAIEEQLAADIKSYL